LQIDLVAARYAYLHAPLPSADIFNLGAYAKDSKHEKDFIPDLQPDDGIFTC